MTWLELELSFPFTHSKLLFITPPVHSHPTKDYSKNKKDIQLRRFIAAEFKYGERGPT